MLIVDACVFIDTFDPQSPNHCASLRLLETLRQRDLLISMPAHGWFEVQCTLKRLEAALALINPPLIFQESTDLESARKAIVATSSPSATPENSVA